VTLVTATQVECPAVGWPGGGVPLTTCHSPTLIVSGQQRLEVRLVTRRIEDRIETEPPRADLATN